MLKQKEKGGELVLKLFEIKKTSPFVRLKAKADKK